MNVEHSGGTTPLDTAIGETVDLLRKHGGKTVAELKAEGNETPPLVAVTRGGTDGIF